MFSRVFVLGCVAALAAAPALAQKKVKTETIRPNAPPAAQPVKPNGAMPEILRDLAVLPEPVRKKREEILAAARTGDLDKLVAVMKSGKQMPVFSFGGDEDPVAAWKAAFPDSDGIEVLSTLIEILEAPFVHVEKGSPQEAYVWPYFHSTPLDKLSPPQRVELFRLVTAYDWKQMQTFGAYNFFRLGIAPDGTWQFFVAGD